MAKCKQLWKTTIVIWTDYDPYRSEIEELAREATVGDAYCSNRITKQIKDLNEDEDWDGTEFFDENGEDDEGYYDVDPMYDGDGHY